MHFDFRRYKLDHFIYLLKKLAVRCKRQRKPMVLLNSCILITVYPLDILSIKKATEYCNN